MSYWKPEDVHSPRSYWRLHRVLHDSGEGGWSIAEGQWENDGLWKERLAIRWNGTTDAEIGNPQSRGLPTWFIVPEGDVEAYLRVALDEKDIRYIQRGSEDGVLILKGHQAYKLYEVLNLFVGDCEKLLPESIPEETRKSLLTGDGIARMLSLATQALFNLLDNKSDEAMKMALEWKAGAPTPRAAAAHQTAPSGPYVR